MITIPYYYSNSQNHLEPFFCFSYFNEYSLYKINHYPYDKISSHNARRNKVSKMTRVSYAIQIDTTCLSIANTEVNIVLFLSSTHFESSCISKCLLILTNDHLKSLCSVTALLLCLWPHKSSPLPAPTEHRDKLWCLTSPNQFHFRSECILLCLLIPCPG